MSQVASTLNLDLIQLHGTESPDISRYLPVPTIKAFHIDSESFSTMQIPTISQPGYNALALLDAKVPHLSVESQGGQGVSFDWSIARQVVEQGHASNNLPILLAGGLTPDNVTEAVVAVRPWAVDVSTGVETDGVKDLEKIKAFVTNAKSV
jgi:anthranilate synthase/indole-3-glycerol phosphate synthase/phosphoribosylanthranilate isomerase